MEVAIAFSSLLSTGVGAGLLILWKYFSRKLDACEKEKLKLVRRVVRLETLSGIYPIVGE